MERGSGEVSGSSSGRSAVSVAKLTTVVSWLTGRIVMIMSAIMSDLDTNVATPKNGIVSASGHVEIFSASRGLSNRSCMKEESIASATIMQMRADTPTRAATSAGQYCATYVPLRSARSTMHASSNVASSLRRKVIVPCKRNSDVVCRC